MASNENSLRAAWRSAYLHARNELGYSDESAVDYANDNEENHKA